LNKLEQCQIYMPCKYCEKSIILLITEGIICTKSWKNLWFASFWPKYTYCFVIHSQIRVVLESSIISTISLFLNSTLKNRFHVPLVIALFNTSLLKSMPITLPLALTFLDTKKKAPWELGGRRVSPP